MGRRLALLLGNGPYASLLHQTLRVDSDIAAVTITLLPEFFTHLTGPKVDHYSNIATPTKIFELLQKEVIEDIVFGGDLRIAGWQSAAKAFVDPFMLRNGNVVRALFSVPAAIRIFSDHLQDLGFTPVLASEFIPDLRPGTGILTEAGYYADAGKENLEADIEDAIERAKRAIQNQPFMHVRQAVVIEGKVIHHETDGTAKLLDHVAEIAKSTGSRILVKLCPEQFDYRMDPPTIGMHTMEQAWKAKIDLIVFEGNVGIMVDRDAALRVAGERGITIFGYDNVKHRDDASYPRRKLSARRA